MKIKFFVILFALFSCTVMIYAKVSASGDIVIMTEKVTNPSTQHGDPTKDPSSPLEIFQTDNVFFFGESYVGCVVSLLLNNVVVFSTVVDEDGLVTLPDTFSGTYELQLAVGDVIYWAMVEL